MFKPRIAEIDGIETLIDDGQIVKLDEFLASKNFWRLETMSGMHGYEIRATYNAAASFIHKRNLEGNESPIKLMIDSHGGLVDAGLQLYHFIKSSNVPIYTIGLKSLSMASLILAAGHKRFLFPHATTMIHLPKGGTYGRSDEVKSQAAHIETLENLLSMEYLNCGVRLSGEELKKMLSAETYLQPEEAIELGFADEIVTKEVLYGSRD